MKETIAFGKTIEEAKENGAKELNVSIDDVTIEVLEAPKSGFLGLGAKPAKLLVRYVSIEEEIKNKEKKKASPAKKEKSSEAKKESLVSPKEEKNEKAVPIIEEQGEKAEEKFVPNEESIPFLEKFLAELFEKMNFNVTFSMKREGKYIYIDIHGDGTGALIGKHGDTLDALQHVIQLALNKAVKGSEKIRLDTEGYREKREKTLVALAKSIASRVIKSKNKYELEPMKAYERKIIHATLQSYPMLTTYSVGVEPERRLIIAFKHRNNQEHK